MKHPINHDCNQAVELACDMSIMSFNIVIKVTVTAKYMQPLFNVSCCTPFFVFYGVHLHLHSGEQSGFALPQVQLEQSFYRSISSTLCTTWNPVELSSKLVPMSDSDYLIPCPCKFCGEGTTRPTCVCALVILISALDELEQRILDGWQFVHCLILLAKQSLLASLTQLKGLVLS